jgi:hypothetical protein
MQSALLAATDATTNERDRMERQNILQRQSNAWHRTAGNIVGYTWHYDPIFSPDNARAFLWKAKKRSLPKQRSLTAGVQDTDFCRFGLKETTKQTNNSSGASHPDEK